MHYFIICVPIFFLIIAVVAVLYAPILIGTMMSWYRIREIMRGNSEQIPKSDNPYMTPEDFKKYNISPWQQALLDKDKFKE